METGRHLFHSRLLKTKNLLLELRPGSTEAFQNGTAMEQQVSDHCGRSRKCVEAYLGRFNLQSQTSTACTSVYLSIFFSMTFTFWIMTLSFIRLHFEQRVEPADLL